MTTECMEVIRRRFSVRSYRTDAVPREKIERCIEAARLAPSACNSQPWHFIVVDDPSLKDAVARCTFSRMLDFNRFALTAPVIVAIAVRRSKAVAEIGGILKKTKYNLIDLGIAAEHFCLQAVTEGLGTCMLGWFDRRAIEKILDVPGGFRVGLLVTLGYPAMEKQPARKRFSRDAIRSYNGFQRLGSDGREIP